MRVLASIVQCLLDITDCCGLHVETGQAVPLLSEWVLQVLLSLVTRLTVNVYLARR